jgi:type I restriction enzyme S subunit
VTPKWPKVELCEVSQIYNGGTPKTSVSEFWDGGNPWVTPAEMGKLETPYLSNTRRTLTDAGLKSSNTKLMPKNSVIMSSRAPIGHLVINSVPMAFNQGCKGIVPGNDLDHKFLYYFLLAEKDLLNSLGSGTTFLELSSGKLKEVEIPLPPLDEQKRIVAKLDEAFSEIDKLEKSVTSIKLQSSFFRTSIYDKYFNFPGPRRVKLGEIANFEGGQQPPKSEFIFEPKDGFIRFIQIRDFKSDKNITYIPDSPRNRICEESDVLIGRYGASVGQILTGLAGAYNVALMKLIPETNLFDTQYAFHYLQSFSFQSQLAKVSKRSAQAGFSKDDISSFLVPLPDLETQVSIVAEIESANLLLDGYESRLNSKGQLLRDLYKSLLNSAFSGDF